MSRADSGPFLERRTLAHVVTATGLTAGQIQRWLTYGAIQIEHEAAGSGQTREFTLGELYDLTVLGRIMRLAKDAGLIVTMDAVTSIWQALTSGESWRCVLDIDLEAP